MGCWVRSGDPLGSPIVDLPNEIATRITDTPVAFESHRHLSGRIHEKARRT